MFNFCSAAKARSWERANSSSRLMQAKRTPFAEKSFFERCNACNRSSAAGALADQKQRRSGLPENETRVWEDPDVSCKLKSGAGKGSRSQVPCVSESCLSRTACDF